MFGNFTKSGFSVFGQALESLGNIVAPIDENENENENTLLNSCQHFLSL
jgi:hypothetical protein